MIDIEYTDAIPFDPTAAVDDFIRKFDAPRDPEFWKGLIREEMQEVHKAAADLLKELADVMYVTIGYQLVGGQPLENAAVGETNVERYAYFLSLVPHDTFAEAFRRVHESNMSKLGDDGEPIRREDGKILKGPNYKPPFLEDII